MQSLKTNHITIFGGASKTVFKEIPFSDSDRPKTLMDFLRAHQVPIASSCLGEGFCRRCIVCDADLSCQISLGDFLLAHPDHICLVSYL